MAHARCSASAASRWIACPGSIREGGKYPNTSSAAADEGTEAHAVAAEFLTKGGYTDNPAIQMYVDYVLSRPGKMYVEVSLDEGLTKLHPDLGGTADAVVIGYDVMEVIDFKYGQGIGVDADNNVQLEIYALGAMLAMNAIVSKVKVTIVQPRHEGMAPIRSWEFDAIDLLDRAVDITEAAEATRKPDAPLVPGSHCHFCPASKVGNDGEVRCPALAKHKTELVVAGFGELTDPDPDKVAQALSMVPGLKAMIKSLDMLAYQMALNGQPPTGYKLVEKRANRKFDQEVKYPEDFYEQVLMSPAQVEKKVGKKFLLPYADNIVKQSSGYALVPSGDKRPPVAIASIEDFSAGSEGDEEPFSL